MTERENLLKIKEFIDQTRDKMEIHTISATREVQTDRGVFSSTMESNLKVADTKEENFLDAKVSYLLLSMEASISSWRSALSESAITETTFNTKVIDLKKNTMAHISRLMPKETLEEKTA